MFLFLFALKVCALGSDFRIYGGARGAGVGVDLAPFHVHFPAIGADDHD
jgi:hypothetical protein